MKAAGWGKLKAKQKEGIDFATGKRRTGVNFGDIAYEHIRQVRPSNRDGTTNSPPPQTWL